MGYVLQGGYQYDQAPTVMRTDEDIDGFLAQLLVAGPEFTAATVYAVDETSETEPDHQVVIGVNAATSTGGLSYAGDDGEWFSTGDHADPDGVVFVYFGTEHEFPSNAEVPLDVVRQALRELLAERGHRPESVTWQRWE
jgi:immunity protein Imm1 of predicted polymorphic toxin system